MPSSLHDILSRVAAGELTLEQAEQDLQTMAAQPMGFATVDHHRHARCGVAEVIYAAGKTPQQVVAIAHTLVERHGSALITRADDAHAKAVETEFDTIRVGARRHTLLVGTPPKVTGAAVPIVSAGTSDEPVAEEAELTFAALGQASRRINDVGVAGIHRLLQRADELHGAGVLVVIAGMEGALPSVVGGMVDCPVIAVPTSVGYGASFGGIAALLGMLTSCASGVTVVNIDNGFGAAYAATLIQRRIDQAEGASDE